MMMYAAGEDMPCGRRSPSMTTAGGHHESPCVLAMRERRYGRQLREARVSDNIALRRAVACDECGATTSGDGGGYVDDW
ncbi:hypothetical protein Dimus_021372, partial [Dionaea muscipula]